MKKIISLLTGLTVITSANTPLSQVVATGDTLSESVYNIKGFKSRNADFVITTIKDEEKAREFIKIATKNITIKLSIFKIFFKIYCIFFYTMI